MGEAGSFSARCFLSRAISISVASLTGVPFPPLDPRNSRLSFIAAALASTNAGSFVSGSVSELSSDELELELEATRDFNYFCFFKVRSGVPTIIHMRSPSNQFHCPFQMQTASQIESPKR